MLQFSLVNQARMELATLLARAIRISFFKLRFLSEYRLKISVVEHFSRLVGLLLDRLLSAWTLRAATHFRHLVGITAWLSASPLISATGPPHEPRWSRLSQQPLRQPGPHPLPRRRGRRPHRPESPDSGRLAAPLQQVPTPQPRLGPGASLWARSRARLHSAATRHSEPSSG